MSYSPRPIALEDYPLLVSWWVAHKWPVVPPDHLSDTGLIIYKDNEPLVAGFLYGTGSAIAWVEWILSNPHSAKLERREALDLLIQELCQIAKTRGFKMVFTSAVHPRLTEALVDGGFSVETQQVTHLTRRLF